MRFNVTSAFNLTQLAVPHLLESDGASVVNIASSAGQFAIRGMSAYGTAKAALIHLTRELAQDLSPKVRVNAVSPGRSRPRRSTSCSRPRSFTTPCSTAHRCVVWATLTTSPPPCSSLPRLLRAMSPARCWPVNGGIQGSNLELGLPDL
jgi:7-alpha-hydroxysteroid dehydrogenase